MGLKEKRQHCQMNVNVFHFKTQENDEFQVLYQYCFDIVCNQETGCYYYDDHERIKRITRRKIGGNMCVRWTKEGIFPNEKWFMSIFFSCESFLF